MLTTYRKLYKLNDEPWLEKWARIFRYHAALPYVQELILSKKAGPIILDIGCGQDILFYKFLMDQISKGKKSFLYYAIDPLMEQKKFPKNVTVITSKFQNSATKKIPEADLIVMFAVLEHVPNPKQLLSFALKKLKPGGKLVITTPSPLAQPILEFFAFGLGIISKREIDEHENYFTSKSLKLLIGQLPKNIQKKIVVKHSYFELGLNNLLVITREK